jgi:23S rRNA pseudouridine1911/1915/1917 synthase
MARSSPTSFKVPEALAGQRLDRAMAALALDLSRGEARRLIAAGVVFVGGRRTGICSRAVRQGESISWESPVRRAPSGLQNEPRIVLHRPEFWIVDKPAGMPIDSTRGGSEGTLSAWLSQLHGPAFVTHRLDVATSGLVAVARNREAQADLNRLFAAHAIGRRYLAVVSPAPPWTRATLDAPLDDRTAVTHAAVLARSPAAAALVVDLETGRTRQIRRHLAQAGFPVVGETAAGARTHARLLLHAFALNVPWPSGPGTLRAVAPAPPDFTSATEALGLLLPDPLPLAPSPSPSNHPDGNDGRSDQSQNQISRSLRASVPEADS